MGDKVMTTRARAPLRLGFAGGGTDLSPYCDVHGGAVLNFTLDRFAYAFITPRKDDMVVFVARDLELEEAFSAGSDFSHGKLALHRAVYQRIVRDFGLDIRTGMTVTTSVDAPAGSGLGSSSALVVALVDAFRHFLDLPLGQYDVAHLAFEVERIDLGFSGGKQDHYSAAFGGANYIEFFSDDRVIVNPLRLSVGIRNELETSLVVCFSGRSRLSAAIIHQQTSAMIEKKVPAIAALHQLKADASDMKRALFQGSLKDMARILERSWAAKKATASAVSNQQLDELHEFALAHGAMAGKVSGAGGGGYMMFLVSPDDRFRLISALRGEGLRASPVKFTDIGCESWNAVSTYQ